MPPPFWRNKGESPCRPRGWGPTHGPPWMRRHHNPEDAQSWQHTGHLQRKRRFFARRFLAVFLSVSLFIGGWMAALAFVVTRLVGGSDVVWLIWLSGCGMSLAIPLVAGAIAARTFRGVAGPMAEVMAAADAVADGDLSVRVTEQGSGELNRLTRSFNRMTAELERSDQQRRNLTADVAHELRTPLHVIQGNLEGILDGVYEPSGEHIEATLAETQRLARLVDDLRTLSLAEAGQLPLTLEALDIRELLADLDTSFRAQADAAGIDLRVEAPTEPLPALNADVGRVYQAVANLMANALRHTEPGGTVRLWAEAHHPATDANTAADAAGLRIGVSDTGCGIAPDALPYVFDRFWRADRARSHGEGAGSGLGLAIARQLIRAHGGDIRAESQLHRGTTFTVTLHEREPSTLE